MSIKRKHTSYFDSLSDLKTRHNLNKDFMNDMFEQFFFNKYKGKNSFNAVVLRINERTPSETKQRTGFYICAKIRPLEMHDFFLPEPCDYSDVKKQNEVIDMHPTAFSDQEKATLSLEVGSIIECFFTVQGPQSSTGQMRGLRFRDSARQYLAGKHFYKCLEQVSANAMVNMGKFNKFVGTATSAVTDMAVRSSSKPTSTMISSVTDQDFVFLFGDSQFEPSSVGDPKIGGSETLGTKLKKQFTNVKIVGKHSKTAQYYLENFNVFLKDSIEKKPKLIMISLGGNGVSNYEAPAGSASRAKSEKDLLNKIKSISPNSDIIWIGPVPPAKDGKKYCKDGCPSRIKKSEALKEEISSMVNSYIDSFATPGFTDGYTCLQYCDGVHMVGIHAENFLKINGLLKKEV